MSREQRQALVIGANGGVGSAVVKALLDRNYTVSATVSPRADRAAFQEEHPGCASVATLDLAKPDSIASTLPSMASECARLNAAIVCGAVAPFAPAETVRMAVMRETMEINCFSNLAIYQLLMPRLREARGRLVLTGSYSGRVATPMMAPYVASKFALEGLTDVMRQEASRWGVHVILLQPGGISTPMVRRSRDALAKAVANLSDVDLALYSDFFRQMLLRAEASLEDTNFISPDAVAKVAIQTIECSDPLARYPIGADAEFLIAASRLRTDREMDDMVLAMYRAFASKDR